MGLTSLDYLLSDFNYPQTIQELKEETERTNERLMRKFVLNGTYDFRLEHTFNFVQKLNQKVGLVKIVRFINNSKSQNIDTHFILINVKDLIQIAKKCVYEFFENC